MNNQEVIKTIVAQVVFNKADKKSRKSIPYRIKYKGEYIVAQSGKTVWPSLGTAKNAFNLEMANQWELKTDYRFLRNNVRLEIKSPKTDLGEMTWQEKEVLFGLFCDKIKENIFFEPIKVDIFFEKAKKL
jgi:hypothetical protein